MIFDKYNKNVWHDSSIDRIVIEYNDIVIFLETDNRTEKIIFKNYIAIDYIGQWDECIVESIYEESDNDIIQNALKKVSNYYDTKYKGGGTRDINVDWKCVVIRLIDSVCIRIVCDSVVFE